MRRILIFKIILAVAGIALAVGLVWWGVRTTEVRITGPGSIGDTAQTVEEIRRIGEWEFVTVETEEMVDTVRHRFLGPDDQLVRIYKGTLRIGIDLSRVRPDFVELRGDTAVVTLPQPRLLSDDFIDEAATVVFHEQGQWGPAARAGMAVRAAERMKARAVTPEALELARDRAARRFSALVQAAGPRVVEIRWE